MLLRAVLAACSIALSVAEPQRDNRVVPLRIKSSWGRRPESQPAACIAWRPGDCDARLCGGFCEARFMRFHDSALDGDRSLKSCSCFRDRLCSVIGSTGCRSYSTLNSFAQQVVRQWTSGRVHFSCSYAEDKKRHMQLLFGNSLFCCHSTYGPRALALRRTTALPYSASAIVTVVAGCLLARL